MTREDAIEVLKRTIAYESDFAEAKQMAIDALSTDEPKVYTEDDYWNGKVPQDDRADTIKELGKWLMQMIQHGVPSYSAKRKALATAIVLLSADRPSEDKLLAEIKHLREQNNQLDELYTALSANTPDIVRCKDCRYFKKIAERSDSGLCHRDIVASAWKENGYCSRGERGDK